MRNHRSRGIEYGVILLLFELMNAGFGVIPPVTLLTILGQALLYMGMIQVPWDHWDVCISAVTVWHAQDWKRLILSCLEHADDRHLYYNMVSFMWKGRSLESQYGSPNFGLLLLFITTLTSCMYVALGLICAHVFEDSYYLNVCAIGFSGVVFALKVITTMESSYDDQVHIMGIRMPSIYAPWAELVLIHLLVPNASFMGHLAGILAGIIYTKTPVGNIADFTISGITGTPIWHEWSFRHYSSSRTRYRGYYDMR